MLLACRSPFDALGPRTTSAYRQECSEWRHVPPRAGTPALASCQRGLGRSKGTATASSGRDGCKDWTRRWVVIVIAPTMAHDARPMWEGQPCATLRRPSRLSWCLLAGACADVCIQRLERLENLIHFDAGAVFQLTQRGPARNRAGVGCPGSQKLPLLRTAHCRIVEDFIGPLE